MRIAKLFAALLLLAACSGQPLPAEKASYAGDWRASEMRILITPAGHVSYERRAGNSSKSIDAPLKRFEGDNFVVGIGPFDTTFVVSKPPWRDQAVWKMTVDGVELVRRGAPDDREA
jgi:hypothetical protein